MSRNQWLLVEWLEEQNILPSYGVVHVSSLVDQVTDLHPGRITYIRSKHGSKVRKAQILRVSEHKQHVKEHKMLMERQDQQVQSMLTMCMRTIKEIKRDPLVYGSPNSSLQSMHGPSGSGMVHVKPSESDSSTDSENEEPPSAQLMRSLIANLKGFAGNNILETAEIPTVDPHTKRQRRSVASSTPLPSRTFEIHPQTETRDQEIQTDPMEPEYRIPPEAAYKIQQFEVVLKQLYGYFLSFIDRLQIDVPTDDESHNSDEEQDRAVEIDREPVVNETLNNSDMEGRRSKRSSNTVQVRRVSAHTTNSVEQNNGAEDDMVPIGAGNAAVPARLLNELNWESYSTVTRRLLQAIFPRKVLATHSLTGKRSPAFANKPAKKCLDPKIIDDIVTVVSERCEVPKRLVRNCITIKCTDEAKLYRNRMQGRPKFNKHAVAPENQENVPPSPAASRESTESG